jgi:biotin carboxylase
VTPQAARTATHKLAMAVALAAAGVPITRRIVIRANEDTNSARQLRCPLVVKPADAQGQSGITRIENHSALGETVQVARGLSREGTVVVEEFVQGPEITATAWVKNGKVSLLALADRVTYNPPPHLGIALRHVFPSFHARQLYDHVGEVLHGVATAYSMSDGPLYVQMLVTGNSVTVVEAAARVGGGHEMSLVPEVTGTDLVDCSINLALGLPVGARFDLRRDAPLRHGLINFVVALPGILAHHEPMEHLIHAGLIIDGGWYRSDGFEQRPITDAYGRIGWFLTTGPDRNSVLQSADRVYRKLAVRDPDGNNLVFWPDPALLQGT